MLFVHATASKKKGVKKARTEDTEGTEVFLGSAVGG